MKIRKVTFNADKTECWIVLDSVANGEYVGTLHTRNQDIVGLFDREKIERLEIKSTDKTGRGE